MVVHPILENPLSNFHHFRDVAGEVQLNMIVPENIRKCVAFIGMKMANGQYNMAGTGFFLGREAEEGRAASVRLVTARHIIDGIRRTGLTEVFIRLNRHQGDAVWFQSKLSDWKFHPADSSVDVALLEMGVPGGLDHLVFPLSLCATEEKIKQNEAGLGDEVFIAGLFRHHHGNQRNVPIIRVGNIACLTEEKIVTKDYGEIDAHLIEARSIGGLSGSPVFLNLGVVRRVGGQVKFAQNGPMFLLFGIVHGHYDAKTSEVDSTATNTSELLTVERVNTGIAIVVPFNKLQEVYSSSEAS